MLVTLDRDYTGGEPGETWERFYASRLVERFQPVSA